MPFTELPSGHRGVLDNPAAQPQTVILGDLKPESERPLPRWADKRLNGEYELYAQLATKVGQRAGNGIVVREYEEAPSANA